VVIEGRAYLFRFYLINYFNFTETNVKLTFNLTLLFEFKENR